MKKISLIYLFLFITLTIQAQVITGKIIDKQTKTPVEAATVYLNGTFIGTSSDASGNFSLDISKYPNMPISISIMGYYTLTVEHIQADKLQIFELDPKVVLLNEIVVKASSLKNKRKEYLSIFKREFLGKGPNSKSCKIINENDIVFDYRTSDTVIAYTKKPLIIDNKALGYKITYFMDEFRYCKENGNLLFIGNVVFNEDKNLKKSAKRAFDKNRKNTFLGSGMHFMRSLWSDKLKSAGFKIYDEKRKSLSFKDIVFQDEKGDKYIHFERSVLIEYKNMYSRFSTLTENVYFDKDGYFYPLDITWKGKIAIQRISDFLPIEFTL